jgi:hypothetical protein
MSSTNSTPAAPDAPVSENNITSVAADMTVTFFKPGEKAKGIRKATTWAKLFSGFAAMKSNDDAEKVQLGAWSPATFTSDYRRKGGAEQVFAAVFDFDNAVSGAKTKTKLPGGSGTCQRS